MATSRLPRLPTLEKPSSIRRIGFGTTRRRIASNALLVPSRTRRLERSMSTKWLEELQEKVANCWEWHSPALQISFRYAKPDQDGDFWEVWAYPAVQEIVGGKEDGETVWSGFHFDVLGFLDGFEPEAVGISTGQPSQPP